MFNKKYIRLILFQVSPVEGKAWKQQPALRHRPPRARQRPPPLPPAQPGGSAEDEEHRSGPSSASVPQESNLTRGHLGEQDAGGEERSQGVPPAPSHTVCWARCEIPEIPPGWGSFSLGYSTTKGFAPWKMLVCFAAEGHLCEP